MSRTPHSGQPNWLDRLLRFCLENKLVVILCLGLAAFFGFMVAPFDWDLAGLPRSPVPVDAIPDLGENQQIVFTEWVGRSPQDVEDQVTYPLTVALLGLPDVKNVRSFSFFGFSTIYVIFDESAEFYASRSRILEKLNSLPVGTLPVGVQPSLGPDATALGQIFWYTLEGRDDRGQPAGGWDLDELRSIQDWQVRYALMSAEGVAEVASVGGFVREYQVDVDPDALRAFEIGLDQVFRAVQQSNVDVGARTIEINRVEYVIRGRGFLTSLDDLARSVVVVRDDVPVTLGEIAVVTTGPALRRSALDKDGAEAVGGVVVVRYGDNPLTTIKHVQEKIAEIAPGLPSRTLPDGRLSRVTIVPFYDRTNLIYETLGTLRNALTLEILITILVVLIMIMHLRGSLLVAGLLPLAVLLSFLGMKLVGVDANIVALSGIAIAIGTMVDMGIVLCENILQRLNTADPSRSRLEVIHAAASEVGGAVLTSVATTIVSFLPVFTLQAAEGKLFKPLAFTKTFALLAAVLVALTVIPPLAHLLFTRRLEGKTVRVLSSLLLLVAAALAAWKLTWMVGLVLAGWSVLGLIQDRLPLQLRDRSALLTSWLASIVVGLVLTTYWLPLGPARSWLVNALFVILCVGGLLAVFYLFSQAYPRMLHWCLAHKRVFLIVPAVVIIGGLVVWQGFGTIFGFLPGVGQSQEDSTWHRLWAGAEAAFPGLGNEFMPPLDEGSFLFMPTTMPHASMGEALDVLQKLDLAIGGIPEVELVVGKIGRAESPLDPAPISMIETLIQYLPEYKVDRHGRRLRFRYDRKREEFMTDEFGELVPDSRGRPYRQWRPEIRTPDDIWHEIVRVARLPGTTSAPKLQPIAARVVMLQSGMRAPMGVKIKGQDLQTLEAVGLQIERLLKQVPQVEPATVIADRIVGKPYLEIIIDRDAIARHGLTVRQVQDVIEVAIGGRRITTTVEGRERYPVRVRYARELRDSLEELENILVPTPVGAQIPLIQLADIQYVRGPQAIKSEDTFLVGYVLFDMKPGHAEVDVVQACQQYLTKKLASGEFELPAGVSYSFAGSYENQVRAQKRLMVVLPVALLIIFLILYLQFRSSLTASMVFSGVLVAWAGGFLLIWLYGQSWFLAGTLFGANLRELFQVHNLNMSVAVWVGFLALFGIATDDGVVMATYLDQNFARRQPDSSAEVRQLTVAAARRRIRPALMTTATTLLALLPVLTSTGRGAEIMVPMAVPIFGGMLVAVLTVFVVPTLYCAEQERRLIKSKR